jgi:hypothetical protein
MSIYLLVGFLVYVMIRAEQDPIDIEKFSQEPWWRLYRVLEFPVIVFGYPVVVVVAFFSLMYED